MKEYIKVILMLLGFVAILFAASLATKFIGNKYVKNRHSKYIKVVDQIMLGKERWLYIIQIGETLLLIGISNNSIELLKKIEHSDLIPVYEEQSTKFPDFLNKYINKQDNKDNDTLITNLACKLDNQVQTIKNTICYRKRNSGEEKDVKQS